MLPPDPTLDEIRAALAPAIAANAAFDGWTPAARDAAALAEGIDPDIARVAFDGAPVPMIAAWFAHLDTEMETATPALATLKVRARIEAQVVARLAAAAPYREALSRALSILALPANVAEAARLGWHAADLMWARAGDTAVDLNHYTKRATLLAIYGATATVFVGDDSEDFADTRAFLARRIDGLMRFEKLKAGLRDRTRHGLSLSRFVGRLRYPVR